MLQGTFDSTGAASASVSQAVSSQVPSDHGSVQTDTEAHVTSPAYAMEVLQYSMDVCGPVCSEILDHMRSQNLKQAMLGSQGNDVMSFAIGNRSLSVSRVLEVNKELQDIMAVAFPHRNIFYINVTFLDQLPSDTLFSDFCQFAPTTRSSHRPVIFIWNLKRRGAMVITTEGGVTIKAADI